MTDTDGNGEDRSDTVSVFNDPPPTIHSLKSEGEEATLVGNWIVERAKAGVLLHEFGVFVQSAAQLEIICWFPESTRYRNFWTTSQRAIKGTPCMDESDQDTRMRMAAFEHVRSLGAVHDHLTAAELKPGFIFEGERIPLVNPQRGILDLLHNLLLRNSNLSGVPKTAVRPERGYARGLFKPQQMRFAID